MESVLQHYPSSVEPPEHLGVKAQGPEIQRFTPEALTRQSESAGMLGRLVLASTELEITGDVEAIPELRPGLIEGGHEDIANIAQSPEKTNEYVTANIELLDKLNELGATKKASEMLMGLAYQLTEGSFSTAIEEGIVDDEQIYRLFSSVSQADKNDQGYLFRQLSGRPAYEFVVHPGEEDVRVARSIKAFEAALDDDTEKGEVIRDMFGKNLARGLNGKDKQDETIENPKMLKKLFMSYGLSDEQAQEVFAAIAQSGSEKYSPQADSRTELTLELFSELKDAETGTEQQQRRIQKLYQKYGIRNFFRYSKMDVLPQLEDGFTPEEVVITAVSDKGEALSKPRNSMQGLKYEQPVYFEAGSPLDIAKSLLRTQKMRRGEPIEKILIRAHGSPEGFLLSETGKHNTVEVFDINERKDGWESLLVEKGVVAGDAEVVFESCSLGAGDFPQSLYESTQLENIFTSPKKITGSALEGSPGVFRKQDGSVRFGVGVPDSATGKRKEDEIAEPVSINK